MLDECGARAAAFDFEPVAGVLGQRIFISSGDERDDQVLDCVKELYGRISRLSYTQTNVRMVGIDHRG